VIGNNSNDPDTIKTEYKNIGYENAYGVNIFANVNIGKLTLNGGGDVYYSSLSNNNDYWLYKAENEGWVASGRLFGSYNLDKGWGFQFFSFVRGNQVQLQGTQGGMYMYGLSIRKEFNEKRGSIGLGAENFINRSLTIKSTTESPAISQDNIRVMNNFNVRINFSYRIGKMSMENRPRRSRRSINNDDLKEGGDMGAEGNMGNMQQTGGAGNMQQGQGQRPNMPTQNQTQTKPVEQQKVEAPADGTVYEATGTWNYTIDSPQGGTGVIVLKKGDDGKYTGTIKSERMREETPFTTVVVDGNNVTLSYNMTFGANTTTVEIKASFNNTDMSGTLAFGQMRTFNLAGKKAN
jgi:hypothetical protein